ADELARLDAADAVLLASGSAAEVFATLPPAPRARRLVAIGPTTAAAADRAGLTVAAVAASPPDDDVAAALAPAPSPRPRRLGRLGRGSVAWRHDADRVPRDPTATAATHRRPARAGRRDHGPHQ